MTRFRRSLALLLVSGVLGATACSSDSGTTQPTTTTARATTTVPATTTTTDPYATATTPAAAYVWGSPLVITWRTLQTFANTIGVNTLFSQTALSNASSRLVVAPNVDTLYSVAVLDLRGGPLVLDVPEIASKYWTYQFVDAWTDSFAYVGTRATGGHKGKWFIAGPDWQGVVPTGMDLVKSPTPQAFLLGRWFPDSDADVPRLAAALKTITLASPVRSLRPTLSLGDPKGTPQSVAAAGAAFFDELGDALAVNPPVTDADKAALARFAPLGIGPGEHPAALANVTDTNSAVDYEGGVAEATRSILATAQATTTGANGWRVRLDIGTYTDPLIRAAVAQAAWGANVPAEAVYAQSTADAKGAAYDGSTTYRMHVAAGKLPPVDAFWSITMYGPDRFFVDNPQHRFAISDRTPGLVRNADGSLDLWFGHTAPAGHEANWLPAPAGRFSLMVRMYLPKRAVLDGRYAIPPVVPASAGS